MESIEPKFIPLEFEGVEPEEQFDRGLRFFELIARRRTVREYSNRDVPFELIERAIATAGTAPSGANLQPWRFVVVRDAEVKRKIPEAAEAEEYESYHNRMSDKWLRRLAPLGTDEHKPFLEIAPYLIVVFRITTIVEDGESEPTYYSQESVGIAVGLLLAALHNMGLATLTHAFANEVSSGDPRTTQERGSLRVNTGWLSRRQRKSPRHPPKTPRRDHARDLA